MDITVMDALVIATTIVGSLITFATGYEKLIVKPKEAKRDKQRRQYAKLQEKERKELVEIRQQEYKVLMETINNAFRPHTEKLERTKARVEGLEVVTGDHEKRLYVIERENGIKSFHYVEDTEVREVDKRGRD